MSYKTKFKGCDFGFEPEIAGNYQRNSINSEKDLAADNRIIQLPYGGSLVDLTVPPEELAELQRAVGGRITDTSGEFRVRL